MKRDYLALWGLLAAAFAIFFCLSTCGDISVGTMTIKSSSLADAFRPDNMPTVPTPVDTLTRTADTVPPEPVQIVVGKPLAEATPSVRPDSVSSAHIASASSAQTSPDSIPADSLTADRPITVLIIGDSMLEGLAPRLAAYCQASGYDLYSVIWYSSTSEIYANSHLLTRYIDNLHPDYIFLSLGGNELFVRDIITKRDPYVKSILAEIGDIPYLWIGPPNWKPDTGINELIKQNVPNGCYFKSDGMHFDRKKDGAHPTLDSAIAWMDSIMRWMPDNAHFRLAVEQPNARTARPKKQYMHKPGPTP